MSDIPVPPVKELVAVAKDVQQTIEKIEQAVSNAHANSEGRQIEREVRGERQELAPGAQDAPVPPADSPQPLQERTDGPWPFGAPDESTALRRDGATDGRSGYGGSA